MRLTQVERGWEGGIDPDPTSRVVVDGFHDAFRYDWSPDGTSLVFWPRELRLSNQLSNAGLFHSSRFPAPAPAVNAQARWFLTPAPLPPRIGQLSGIFAHARLAASAWIESKRWPLDRLPNAMLPPSAVLSNQLFIAECEMLTPYAGSTRGDWKLLQSSMVAGWPSAFLCASTGPTTVRYSALRRLIFTALRSRPARPHGANE